jgi:hypothetical protein
LRHGVWPVEQEDGDLLVRLLAHVHGAVKALRRLLPSHLSRRDLDAMALAAIAILDQEDVATQDNGDALKRVAMPRHRLARSQAQPAHQGGFVLEKDFVGHRICRSQRWLLEQPYCLQAKLN